MIWYFFVTFRSDETNSLEDKVPLDHHNDSVRRYFANTASQTSLRSQPSSLLDPEVEYKMGDEVEGNLSSVERSTNLKYAKTEMVF